MPPFQEAQRVDVQGLPVRHHCLLAREPEPLQFNIDQGAGIGRGVRQVEPGEFLKKARGIVAQRQRVILRHGKRGELLGRSEIAGGVDLELPRGPGELVLVDHEKINGAVREKIIQGRAVPPRRAPPGDDFIHQPQRDLLKALRLQDRFTVKGDTTLHDLREVPGGDIVFLERDRRGPVIKGPAVCRKITPVCLGEERLE